MILDKINSPKDLKQISFSDMAILADEMRELIINKVETVGGHMGPNLGIVEATLALHYVFNSPVDKFIFDVSHQCYTHKMITGRKETFTTPELYSKYTGFTAPEESEHDLFKVGHTSTSVSLANGVAKARDLRGEDFNVIAIIGDGSLSGGEAFEGLDNASKLNSNLIVLVNDNEMSIAENVGGLYDNLRHLRETQGQYECNFFKSLGFDYIYEEEGNNIEKLVALFEKVKDINHPIVVHIHTLKGKGYEPAIENKEKYHNRLSAQARTANALLDETYYSLTRNFLLEKSAEDKTVITVNAATPGGTGLTPEFRKQLGKQFVDVGICEEHAMAFISGLAKTGANPFYAIQSSFLQRTYDQISQDICLNNSPVTMLVYNGEISNMDATHLGVFDIPLVSNIPNMVYLAPTCKEEYLAMLEYAYKNKKHPLALRLPKEPVVSTGIKDTTDYSILNKFKVEERGKTVAIIGVGNFLRLAKNVKFELKDRFGIDATVINPRFISGLDKDLLNELKEDHSLVVTLENGCVEGGFGEKVAKFYGESDVKVLVKGADKEFTDKVSVDELYSRYRLTTELITKDIEAILEKENLLQKVYVRLR